VKQTQQPQSYEQSNFEQAAKEATGMNTFFLCLEHACGNLARCVQTRLGTAYQDVFTNSPFASSLHLPGMGIMGWRLEVCIIFRALIYLSIYLSFYLIYLSIYLSFYLIYLSILSI